MATKRELEIPNRQRVQTHSGSITCRYNPDTDSLGVFFGDTVPSPLFQEDDELHPGVRLLSDLKDYFVGITILKASTKLPTGRKLSDEEILAWLWKEYPHLVVRAGAKFLRVIEES
jgi:hypothetical protein